MPKCAWNHCFLLDDVIWRAVRARVPVSSSTLNEAQTCSTKQKKCGWQCFGRNSCGWAGQCVAACVDLSVFLQSYPSTEGLQRSQWVGVKSKEVRKTTTGSASSQGLSTATASCICLTFPKQNTEPPNSSFHFPPADSHIFFHIQKPNDSPDLEHLQVRSAARHICFVDKSYIRNKPRLPAVQKCPPDPPPHTHTHTLPVCEWFQQSLHLLPLSGMFLLAPLCTMVTRVTSFFLAGQDDGRKRRETVTPTNQGAGYFKSYQ